MCSLDALGRRREARKLPAVEDWAKGARGVSGDGTLSLFWVGAGAGAGMDERGKGRRDDGLGMPLVPRAGVVAPVGRLWSIPADNGTCRVGLEVVNPLIR